jgi:ADP-ribose pyrophosphatase
MSRLIWKKISEIAHSCGRRKILKKTFQLPNGLESVFDIKDEGQAVSIIAVTDNNEIVMVKQFRTGPEEWLVEIPGGAVDPGESPLDAAKRELREETGFEGQIESIGSCWDCGFSNIKRFHFVAHHCKKVSDPKPDPEEFLETVMMSPEDFLNHLRQGNLTDVEAGYRALDHLGWMQWRQNK